jgi:hypothetical protein
LQLLAIQAADEARISSASTGARCSSESPWAVHRGRAKESLKTLLDEPDFALAFFLLVGF